MTTMKSIQKLLNDPAKMAGLEDRLRRADVRRLGSKQASLQAKADAAAAKADQYLSDKGVPPNMSPADYLDLTELAAYSDLEDVFDAAQDAADKLDDREIERRAG